MPTVLFADEQDDIASIRTRLERAAEPDVALVVPRENRALASPAALRLLLRQSRALAVDVSLVTRDPTLRRVAREEGLRVFSSQRAFERELARRSGGAGGLAGALADVLGQVPALVAAAASVGVALVAAAVAYVVVPTATVTVSPRAAIVAGIVPVVADPTLRSADVAGGRVPARAVYLLVEGTDQVVPGEGRGAETGRAVGAVTLTNRSPQETVVPRGTVVSTPEGARFRTDLEVRLPAGLGQSRRVQVAAVESGPLGNVPRARIIQVEGLLKSYVLVANDEPTAGGGATTTPAITEDDRARLQARAMERGRQEALLKLAAMAQGRDLLIQQSFEFTPLDVSFDHAAGEDAPMLGVLVKARAVATIVSLDSVEDLARKLWTPTVPPGFQLSGDAIHMAPPEVTRVDGRVVTLAVRLEGVSLAALDLGSVQRNARWRTPAEIERDLPRAFDLARPPAVRVAPGWAQRAYRVDVVIDRAGSR